MAKKAIAYFVLLFLCSSVVVVGLPYSFFLPLVSLTVSALFLIIFHKLYNLTNWIDPTILFIVYYTTFTGIGVAIAHLYDVILVNYVLISIPLGLICFCAGALLLEFILSSSGRLRIPRTKEIYCSFKLNEILWACIFLLIGLCFVVYYFWRIGNIPLLAQDAENVRVSSKAGQGYIPIIAYALITVSTSVLTAWVARKNYLKILGVALIVLISAFFLLGVGFRAPALKILLNAFLIYLVIRKNYFPIKKIMQFGIFVVLSVGLLGFFRMEASWTTSFETVLRIGAWRIFVNNLYVLNLVFLLYPKFEPFMLGSSYWIDIATILPGPQAHFGFWLKNRLGLHFEGGGVTQTILGEFYLNFGWLGVIIGMFLLGCAFRVLYRILTGSRHQAHHASRVSLLVLLSTSLMGIVSSGLFLVLFFDTFPILFVYLGYFACTKVTTLLLEFNRQSLGRNPVQTP